MRADHDGSPQWYKDGMAAWNTIREEAEHAKPKHAESSPEDQEMLEQESIKDTQTSQEELDDGRVEQQEPKDDTAMDLDEIELPTAAKGNGKEVAESSGAQVHAALLNQLRAKIRECNDLQAQLARSIQPRESVATAVGPSTLVAESATATEVSDATQAVAAMDLTGPDTGTANAAGDGVRASPPGEVCTDYKFKKCSRGAWHVELPKEKQNSVLIRLDLTGEDKRDKATNEQ